MPPTNPQAETVVHDLPPGQWRWRCLRRCFWSPTAAGAAKVDDPAPNLKHGINLSNWFTDFSAVQPLTASMRFRLRSRAGGIRPCVRIPINPESLGFSISEASTGRVLFDFAGLDAAIDNARNRGLSVILDIQPGDGLLSEMEQDPRTEPAMIALCSTGSPTITAKTYSVGTMVYELLDSPRYNSVGAYHNLVSDIVSGLHDVAAKNTIIVDMPKQASVDGFAGFTPLTTGTVRYAFHFYEPYLFTHQGLKMASSFGRSLRNFRNLPYPAAQVNAGDQLCADRVRSDRGQDRACRLCRQRIGTRAGRRLPRVSSWRPIGRRRTSATVICTEFGVVRRKTPSAAGALSLDRRYPQHAGGRVGSTGPCRTMPHLFGIVTLTGDTATDSDGAVRLADPTQGSRDIEPDAIKALFAN